MWFTSSHFGAIRTSWSHFWRTVDSPGFNFALLFFISVQIFQTFMGLRSSQPRFQHFQGTSEILLNLLQTFGTEGTDDLKWYDSHAGLWILGTFPQMLITLKSNLFLYPVRWKGTEWRSWHSGRDYEGIRVVRHGSGAIPPTTAGDVSILMIGGQRAQRAHEIIRRSSSLTPNCLPSA